MYSTLKQTCCIHRSRKLVNIKIGITNIQMYLQFKRLQLCPCPLCVLHKYWKGVFPGRNIHQHRKFLRSNPLKLLQIFTKQILQIGVYSQEIAESGNLQLGSRNSSYSLLRKELKQKADFDKFFSKDFWNGKYKCEKKTNFTRKSFTQRCEGRKRHSKPSWEQQLHPSQVY